MARAYQLPDGRTLQVCPGLGGTWIIGVRNPATGSSHRYRGLGVYDTREAAEEALHQKAGEISATQGPSRWWAEVEPAS